MFNTGGGGGRITVLKVFSALLTKALCAQLKRKMILERIILGKGLLKSSQPTETANGNKRSESFSKQKQKSILRGDMHDSKGSMQDTLLYLPWGGGLGGGGRGKNTSSQGLVCKMVKGVCIPAGVQIFWIFSPTTTGFSFRIFSAASAL